MDAPWQVSMMKSSSLYLNKHTQRKKITHILKLSQWDNTQLALHLPICSNKPLSHQPSNHLSYCSYHSNQVKPTAPFSPVNTPTHHLIPTLPPTLLFFFYKDKFPDSVFSCLEKQRLLNPADWTEVIWGQWRGVAVMWQFKSAIITSA